ncbi:ROK family protein [Hwanghaeella grinnelliae]|uniref:ROK family protein n=1 Tax=Hwanghaeella grinnelliae TaxID=2500179 RepID=A0A3S2Y4K3_9PROT|nr:ROK family protein [Hwanghaeella grinnelliae]RVU38369.1 ROK family protein [Hwanghaeella grinnelliae]
MRIGIDLGGTKIEGIALDSGGEIIARRRIEAPQGRYQDTLDAIKSVVRTLEIEAGGQAPVGVGMPGTVSRDTGLVKNANSVWLIGNPIDRDLEKVLDRPVRVTNDANCFALSESVDGAAAGSAIVFGVILGTGVGGGLVVNGGLVDGPNGITGEWGHNPLPWPRDAERPGPTCYCGKQGCIETFLSGPGLSRDHFHHTGTQVSADILAGDSSDAAEETFRRYEDRLARALSHMINIVDPDAVVLGGGLSNIKRLYTNIPVLLKDWVFSDQVNTRLLPPRHGDSSGVRGAAWLWPEE